MQKPTRTALSFSNIAPRRRAKYTAYDIMTTPQNSRFRTSICVTSKNATIYGPTSGYTNGLINATHKEVHINPGASSLPMATSPMNVATIRATAWIASDFNQLGVIRFIFVPCSLAAQNVTRAKSLGKNMMQPTIAAPIAATRTAPAAQSLAFFASGWMFGEARSTTASTAVFRHSRDMTSAQQMTIAAHSRPSSPNHAPSTTTATAAARWMRMFRSLFTVAAMPEIACIKDRIIFPLPLIVRNTRERRIPPVRRRCV